MSYRSRSQAEVRRKLSQRYPSEVVEQVIARLVEQGYLVDCSVTPHVSWKRTLGDPDQAGGTDYTRFPEDAYFIDLADISRPGDSPLLEMPMTILSNRRNWTVTLDRAFSEIRLAQGAWRRLFPPVYWLRPNGRNRESLLRILRQVIAAKKGYVEFMLHSSELMPGGSPTFPEAGNIERLYDDLEILFSEASEKFVGSTLKEHYQRVAGSVVEGKP